MIVRDDVSSPPEVAPPPARVGPATSAWVVFGAAVVLQLVILYWPRTPSEDGLPIDKLVHVGTFFLVLVSGAWALGISRLPALAVVLALHAPGSELIQHDLLPHRDGSWADAGADLLGVLAGVLVVIALRRVRADE